MNRRSVLRRTGSMTRLLQFSLARLYEGHLKPNLEEVADSLLERAVRRLAERHRTLRSWQEATRDSDAMSFHRSAIEPHEQDQDRYRQFDRCADRRGS